VTEGLVLEGVAVTAHPVKVPLASGLVALDGRTTRTLVMHPHAAVYTLPLPLLWNHDRAAPIGEVVAAEVADGELRFRAVVAAPGTAGYDAELLRQVWAAVESDRESCCVSVLHRSLNDYDHPDRWEWLELSLVSEGSHPHARVTRVERSAAA
jgi:hypothetical protein